MSRRLTLASITEYRTGTRVCQAPLPRREMVLDSFRRPKGGSCGETVVQGRREWVFPTS